MMIKLNLKKIKKNAIQSKSPLMPYSLGLIAAASNNSLLCLFLND